MKRGGGNERGGKRSRLGIFPYKNPQNLKHVTTLFLLKNNNGKRLLKLSLSSLMIIKKCKMKCTSKTKKENCLMEGEGGGRGGERFLFIIIDFFPFFRIIAPVSFFSVIYHRALFNLGMP